MLIEQTLQTLNALRLPGMAAAFAEQQASAETTAEEAPDDSEPNESGGQP